jgi:hypothetical protein
MAMVFRMRGSAKERRDSSDVTFIVFFSIAAIGLIVVSYALGVAFDPDQALSIFAAP